MPRYQDTFAREASWGLTPPSGTLPEAPKILDFTTHTAVGCNVQKTYYLLHFRHIFGVPQAPKSVDLGYPKRPWWCGGVVVTTKIPTSPSQHHPLPATSYHLPATSWYGGVVVTTKIQDTFAREAQSTLTLGSGILRGTP